MRNDVRAGGQVNNGPCVSPWGLFSIWFNNSRIARHCADGPNAPGRPIFTALMDIIFINDLRIDAVIGIYEWERKVKQTLSIDLELACDCARAAASDSVDDTVNYKQVSQRLQEFVGESEFKLVETLAERVAALILDEFSVRGLKLRVNKIGALRGAAGVGVIIERGEAG